MLEGKNHLNALENHLNAFHVLKLPTWLADHGSLLTAPFVLCSILCALSSLALIALEVSCETLSSPTLQYGLRFFVGKKRDKAVIFYVC